MDQDGIRESIESLVAYLGEHPEKRRNADPPATAVMIDGLRCRAEGPGGASIVSDMPRAVGGGDSAPLREIVAWVDRHSPVGDALRRAIPVEVEVLTGEWISAERAGRGRSPRPVLHRFPFLFADPVAFATGTLSRSIRSALPK